MAKERCGYTFQDKDGRWYARVTFTDKNGRRRNVKRRAENRSKAKDVLRQLTRSLDDHGENALIYERMTFNELADYYEERYAIPAQYVDGRKIAGLRSCRTALQQLEVLRDYFGNQRLRSITHGELERFKAKRLAVPTYRGTQRSIARVNRELAQLRRMLNIALREGWILRNPFTAGDCLISSADEKKRERILTREEEERLLAACTGRRAHLKPLIICALDTGMRQGELLKLKWSDIDFAERLITVRAFNTKTMSERQVAMTARVEREIWQLYQEATNLDALVFGIMDNVKKSFSSVRKTAGLPDVRFHDLRHTAATRLVAKHISLPEVGRILGHTQPITTYRYTNANKDTARRAAMALDEFHSELDEQEWSESVIN